MRRTQISLTEADRHVLDAEAARTGRSISALIRDAVAKVYGAEGDLDADLRAIELASGAWSDRDVDGAAYVESLRSGGRLKDAAPR
ncbi:ribbon-helix-helix domain-containing protein [Georgenia yuyongxinii]